MNDMSAVIVPKSDQINADDLLAGPKTIRITEVNIRPGTEQPVAISFGDGDEKVWRPCKSMSRVLVAAWGPDAKVYVGRSVTLYCDPKVKWGGMEVGGIRISHMSHIDRDMVMALTATKGKRAPYTVKPLAEQATKQRLTLADWITTALPAELAKYATIAAIEAFTSGKVYVAALKQATDDQKAQMQAAVDAAVQRVSSEDDPFAGDAAAARAGEVAAD